MTSKEWLRKARRGSHRLRTLQETKERLFTAATSVTASYDGEVVKNSNISNKPEQYATAKQYVTANQEEQIRYWINYLKATAEAIYRMDDPLLQDLLELYYINGHTFEEVADALNYSTEHVIKVLHKNALEAFQPPENMA